MLKVKIVDVSLKSKEYLTKCSRIPIVPDERDRGCRNIGLRRLQFRT